MSIKCVLEILKKRKNIKCGRVWTEGHHPEKRLIVKKGQERLFKKIDTILLESENYKHTIHSRNELEIRFFEISELKEWLDETYSKDEKKSCVVGIPDYMKVWINNCTEYRVVIENDCGLNKYYIINEKIEKQRLEKEQADENEAIELLEKIL